MDCKKLKVSISRNELIEYANNHQAFYSLDLARISTSLFCQIIQIQSSKKVSVYSILDEVKHLEGFGNTTTKPADMYKHLPLRGLYKKHWCSARFVQKNISNEFSFANGGNKKLDRIINEETKEYIDKVLPQEFWVKLTNRVIKGYKDRASSNKLTGEWIIFQKYNGKNYYLCIAAHNEEDDTIWGRVKVTYEMDFPFLKAC